MEYLTIDFTQKEYPASLRLISSPPKKLFAIGKTLFLQKPCVAVVGSRKCTDYGKQVAKKIGKTLSENGIVVVSGLANGIDRMAHIGALEGGGNTIGVLATSIDKCYPARNQDVYNAISTSSLLLSEHEPGYKCMKYDFPLRNRIISGLSSAVIVVEAPDRSGALITAELAMDQGRELYAVPGNITSFFSLGSNKLIRDGAKPIALISDLLADLDITPTVKPNLLSTLEKDEAMIYRLIEKKGEVTAEALIDITCMTVPRINGLLTVLEMKGLIASSLGKFFIIN